MIDVTRHEAVELFAHMAPSQRTPFFVDETTYRTRLGESQGYVRLQQGPSTIADVYGATFAQAVTRARVIAVSLNKIIETLDL